MDALDFGQLLKAHPEMLDDSKKFAAILRDIYPREKGNINLMLTAYNAGVVPMLRKSDLDGFLTARIINLLMDDYGIAESKARQAAELWIDAYSFFATGTLPVKAIPSAPDTPAVKPAAKTVTKPVKTVTKPVKTVKQPAQQVQVQPPAPALRESSPTYFKVKRIYGTCTIVQYIGPKTGQVVIPTYITGLRVTAIKDSAFKNCTGLTSIVIPDSVKEIDNYPFCNCTGLTSMVIPKSVTRIGKSAFCGCTGLTSVTIPNNVTEIGDDAFAGCTGLTSIAIPNRVQKIGMGAFEGCTGLTSITIPDGVREIGLAAFKGCTGLTSVTIPARVREIEALTFMNCTGLRSVTILKNSRYNMSIDEEAFKGCIGLASITIPKSIDYIFSDSFEQCPNLTIRGTPGSYAEKYAKQFRIPFQPVGER